MIKSSLVGLSLLLVSAGSLEAMQTTSSKHHVMFQTVTQKEATLVQNGAHKESCVLCGMNLVKFYKTSHSAVVNGKPKQYCSLHCMANAMRHGEKLKNKMVVDVVSLKFIPVEEAHYVVGSKVHGTMSHVSKYAFKSLEDAKAFQKKHGGKILDFQEALKVANRDFVSKKK